ncbi:microtubule-associated protein 10-like [Pecten maximus]|uniref:microtubule-associated protein 10-like n=1 Tax=Pecten maximus TaxID=6579 RepID=UPI0014589989|nr:microtubule-associated protein 10-like [Pecten maximus]
MAKVTDKESLFSLELVVEKLYIPHVACRFPAVAFRLLDFPTILVEHVEKELGDKIRRKISTDPYYNVPEQFTELKDKHGNFMMKKGKSCLFKVAVSSLKTHLTNAPLYVMVIDNFPKVSKLLGNCTVPLDEVMDLIINDIKTLGPTVPSVHGDKGLYKIYSLMGKEIGYIILGYRLLSLGPGLIPHIPESAIAKRMSTEVDHVPEQNFPHQRDIGRPSKRDGGGYSRRDDDALMTTQEMGSMTDPEKHDVILQTVSMCDKEIHVAISEPEVKSKSTEDKGIIVKDLKTIATQTFKRSKPKPDSELHGLDIKNGEDDGDDIIAINIAQPPPLFYNSEIEPARKTQRLYAYNNDESSDELISEEEVESAVTKREIEKRKKEEQTKRERQEYLRNQQSQAARVTFMNQQQPPLPPAQIPIQETRIGDQALFPLLTALMQEISNIQNPQLIHQTVQQVKSVSRTQQQQQRQQPQTSQQQKQTAPEELEKENQNTDQDGPSQRGRKSHRTCAHPHDGVPGQRSWLRQTPQLGVKKSKLTYGLTNTQRLRLAKFNPDWAKNIDKEENYAKVQKQKLKKSFRDDQEFDTGNLSDTLTEVRRLAEKNLQDTLAEDTLLYGTMNSTSKSNRRRISPPRRKQKQSKNQSKSPRSMKQTHGKSKSAENLKESSKSVGQKSAEDNLSDPDTPSLPSQKSIQVRIPSAQMYEESDDEDFSDFEEKAPTRNGRFPGFHDDNESLPDSIGAEAMDNRFDNDSFELKDDDFDQPLESTRNSKPSPPKAKKKWLSRKSPDSNLYNDDSFESDISPRREKAEMPDKSRTFQSTEDYSTHQFQSTEEPELQRLMSSGERSELSDVMSSEKSAKSPLPVTASMNSARFQVINPKASLQSPIPALRRSQVKLDGSMGRPSPTGTPRSQTSSRFPTPKPRKVNPREKRTELKRESLHTESISSYVPSDGDFNPSLESDNYSDDFSSLSGREELKKMKELPRIIPSTKLGYTIH